MSAMISATTRASLAIAALLALAGLQMGCAPVLVVGAATYGGTLLHERRTGETVLADETIEWRAQALLWQLPEPLRQARARVISYNQVALLVGQAPNPAIAQALAARIAALPQVRRVYNEMTVGPPLGVAQISTDTYLGTRAKLALAAIQLPDFDPLRVKIVVEAGTVYLLGLVTPAEAEASIAKIRHVPEVQRVVSLFEYVVPPAAAS